LKEGLYVVLNIKADRTLSHLFIDMHFICT